MTSAKLRQRILGATVILSLGFILFSVLIQTESSTYIDRSARIPVQTVYIEPLEINEPRGVRPDDRAELDTTDMFVARESVTPESVATAPILNEQGKPNSWVIKVGSFSTSERALEIRDQLVDDGYRAYHAEFQRGQGAEELYQVLVGPYLDADEIADHQARINELLALETILMAYEP